MTLKLLQFKLLDIIFFSVLADVFRGYYLQLFKM